MIIPFWILLIPACIIVALVVIFALINLLQVYRFGFFSVTALVAFAVFAALASVVVFQTLGAISGVDWSAPLFSPHFGTSTDIINF